MEERLRVKIHPDLRDKVSLEAEKDVLLGYVLLPRDLTYRIDERFYLKSVMSSAISSLLRELELACEPAFSAMARSPWRDVEFVSSESTFVLDLVRALEAGVGMVRSKVEQKKFLRSVCDRVVRCA